MKLKWRWLLALAVLVLVSLACETLVDGGVFAEPTSTPRPTKTPVPTPSPTPRSPQGMNSGRNFYIVTVTEQGCSLSLSAAQQYREIVFDENMVSIKNNSAEGWENYDPVGPQRFMRINDAGKPIVIEFSLEGYRLEIYNVDDDPDTVEPCGYFTFTLLDPADVVPTIPPPTATPPPPGSGLTPEDLNDGRNFYLVTVTEQGCPLSLSADQQYREIQFDASSASIKSKSSEDWFQYDQIAPHRYLRYNDAGKPIVVEFSMEGYVLEVYNVGDDPNMVAPCGFFTFILAGD